VRDCYQLVHEVALGLEGELGPQVQLLVQLLGLESHVAQRTLAVAVHQHHAEGSALPLQLDGLLHVFLGLRLLLHLLFERLAAWAQLRLAGVFFRWRGCWLLRLLAWLQRAGLASRHGLLRVVEDFLAFDDLDAVVGQGV